MSARRAERLRLLLGDKEGVAFEALRLARRSGRRLRRRLDNDTISALLLASLLSKSDRTRIQIYRALDTSDDQARRSILEAVRALEADATKYRGGLDDLESFKQWSMQISGALPWLRASDGG